MSGYLSRIAKQSGIRFSNGGNSPGDLIKNPGEPRLMPIDREETVMIAPQEPVMPDRPKATAKVRDVGASGKLPRPQRSENEVPGPGSITKPSHRGEGLPSEPVIEEVKLVAPESPDSSPASKDSLALAEQEDEAIRREPGRGAQRPINIEKRQTDTATSEVPDKRFFEMTSSIIEGRDAEPSEVQTIVINEVQEWIAAGRIPTDDIMPDLDVESSKPYTMPPIAERKRGVIRIDDRVSPEVNTDHEEERRSSPSEVHEQNFEISIGSISVVIDGEDSAPQPATAVAAPPSVSRATPPGRSRLSRNYL
jgi:hypothetical protein